MSEGKFLIIALSTILILGVLFTGIAGSFSSEDELNDTWVAEAGIDSVFGAGIDLFKYPISAVAIIIDFFDGDFWSWLTYDLSLDEYEAYCNITGSGIDSNVGFETLDGTYLFYNSRPLYDLVELVHEDDTGLFTRKRFVEIYYNETAITDINITAPKFIGRDDVYSLTSITEGTEEYILNLDFEKTAQASSYNWSDTAEGVFVAGSEFRENSTTIGYESNSRKVADFFDEKVKPSVRNGVKSFGLIPEVIGIPIFIILLVGMIYSIIKLFPTT